MAVSADEQAALVVQVADRAFDDVALGAEPAAVFAAAAGDRVSDAPGSQHAAVLVVVIAPVGEYAIRPLAWPTERAAYCRDRIDKRNQLRDVVAVGAGHRPGQEQAAGVGQDVVFDPRAAAVDRAWSEPAAPFFACT